MGVLDAKTRPPRYRAGLIERSDLEPRLTAALCNCRLTLVVAPAGYGKTAALARQFDLLGADWVRVWVQTDHEDDLSRLLACLREALEPYDPPWRVSPAVLADVDAQPLNRIAAQLAVVLEGIPAAQGLIVFDDLHFVSDTRVFAFLDLLLAVLPDRWRIVVSSRVSPPLALEPLRAARALAEFRQDDLCFSAEEVRLLCRASGSEADDEEARQLHATTQGWAVGVCLSLGSASRRGLLQLDRRHLFEYLAQEVYGQLSPELQLFLVRCSILPELTASRCAAVSGNPRAAALLDEVQGRNLFVTMLDGAAPTLRLHDLMRDFLEERLRTLHPGEVPSLLRRAAEHEADPVRRVGWLLRAGAWPEAEQVIADLRARMLVDGRGAQLAKLVAQFPEAIRDSSPEIAFATGLVAAHNFEDVAAQAAMRRAAIGYQAVGRSLDAGRAMALEAVALLYRGRFDEALARMDEVRAGPTDHETRVLAALFGASFACIHGPVEGPAVQLDELVDLLEEGASGELWFRCMPRLYLMLGRTGTHAPLRRFVRGAKRVAGEDQVSLPAAGNVLDAWLLLWVGRCDEAEAVLQQLDDQVRWLGQPLSLRVPSLRAWGTYYALRGDRAGVEKMAGALMANVPPSTTSPHWRVNVLNQIGRFHAALDDDEALDRGLQALGRDAVTGLYWPLQLVYRTLWARHRLVRGDHGAALAELAHVFADEGKADQMGRDASARVYGAVANLRAGAPERAWALLAPLVASTTASGEIAGVLLAGPSMLAELAAAAWNGAAPPEGRRVIESWWTQALALRQPFEAPRPSARTRERSAADEAVESADASSAPVPLTRRELEVLAMVARGTGNKEIAVALGLSMHTVKRHVARILERLELASRGEAAAWYHRHQSPVSPPSRLAKGQDQH